jgi:hypothetical protein
LRLIVVALCRAFAAHPGHKFASLTDDGVIPPLLRLGAKRRADTHLLLREEKVIELGAIR